jgi:hypothetical protein
MLLIVLSVVTPEIFPQTASIVGFDDVGQIRQMLNKEEINHLENLVLNPDDSFARYQAAPGQLIGEALYGQ